MNSLKHHFPEYSKCFSQKHRNKHRNTERQKDRNKYKHKQDTKQSIDTMLKMNKIKLNLVVILKRNLE